jgi:transcriptional regulator with XRE-family HTH domain
MLIGVLGVPRYTIHQWASQLKLSRRKARPWTTGDLIYLEANLHQMSYEQLAQKLERTEAAVYLKAQGLGLNKSHEGYTLRGLAAAFGVSVDTVKRWIDKGWLKGKRRQSRREQVGDIWYFSDAAVKDFVRRHPEAVDPAKADWLWLVDVLCGGIGELGNSRVLREEE